MKGPTQEELVAEAALAFAESLFPRTAAFVFRSAQDEEVLGRALSSGAAGNPPRSLVALADAHWLLTGRVDLWDQWDQQSDTVKAQIGELLRYRHNDLASEKHFRLVLERLVARTDSGYAALPAVAGQPTEFVTPVHGTAAEVHAKTLLASARRRHLQSLAWRSFATPGNYHPGGRPETTIAIPSHAKPDGDPIEVSTAGALDQVRLTCRSLLRFAAALDRAAEGKPWRYRILKCLFDGLRDRNSATIRDLAFTWGELEQLIAPTGVGKSVLIREFAVLLAACGVPAAVVGGSVNETLASVDELRAIARVLPTLPASLKLALGIVNEHPRIAPMIAARRIDGTATRVAGRGQWHRFDELAYGCDARGWTVNGPAPAGADEPCTSLTPAEEGGDQDKPGPARLCIRMLTCGKSDNVRRAAQADLVVTNHHNFLLGNLQVPLVVDGEAIARCSVMEFVLRRCQVVLVDEVDRAKSILYEADANEVVLAVKGGAKAPLTDLNLSRKALSPRLDRELHPALARTSYLAEQLLNYVLDDDLRFEADPERPELGWRLPGSHNRLLLHALGLRRDDTTPPEYAVFDSLFPDQDPARRTKLSTAQQRLANLLALAVSNDGVDNLSQLKLALAKALKQIRTELIRQGRGDQASVQLELPPAVELLADALERERLVNHLLVKTWLGSLHQAMTRLTYETTRLAGVPALRDVLPQLRTYTRHTPVPFGPIGYLLFGFRIVRDHDRRGDGRLSTQAISGDPHTTISRLGDIVALTYSGHRRIVIGLSATAYFPGAVREHLDVVPTYTMTDAVPGAFSTSPGQAMDANQLAFHVGGQLDDRKPAVIEKFGAELWHQQLDGHLRNIAAKDPDRERCLIAVNSYKQVGHLAAGLVRKVPDPGWIGVLVRESDPTVPVALPDAVVKVTIDQIEDLPRTHPAVKVIVAPLTLVARGLNILIPDSERSALSSLWVAVRPPMSIDAPAEILAHVTDYALRDGGPSADPVAALRAQRERAQRRLHKILNADPRFSRMPRDLKAEAVAGMIVDLIQLAGRARRGSTPVQLFLSDGAFHDEAVGSDLAGLLDFYWGNLNAAQQAQMRRVYGETLRAWLDFAKIP